MLGILNQLHEIVVSWLVAVSARFGFDAHETLGPFRECTYRAIDVKLQCVLWTRARGHLFFNFPGVDRRRRERERVRPDRDSPPPRRVPLRAQEQRHGPRSCGAADQQRRGHQRAVHEAAAYTAAQCSPSWERRSKRMNRVACLKFSSLAVNSLRIFSFMAQCLAVEIRSSFSLLRVKAAFVS